MVKGKLVFASEMDDITIENIRCKFEKLVGEPIQFETAIDSSILGGFLAIINGKTYQVFDNSMSSHLDEIKSRLKNNGAADAEAIIMDYFSPEKEAGKFAQDAHKLIDGYVPKRRAKNVGQVLSVGDGVVHVAGLERCKYGELLRFENEAMGIALNLDEQEVGAVLLNSQNDVSEESFVFNTGEVVSVPVGEALLGRVVNPLGEAIDSKGTIHTEKTRPIETEAPPINDRQGVSQPLETGILAIDSMIPIGKGQRELIIGDRQTGKTAIAVDTILNQKGKDVICIYVAIGQKASTIADIIKTLDEYGASDYTIVVAATASDSAPMQYIAPYSGCAMAEEFMEQGKDVLVVYDDLSKHAVAYRAMSLLLRRPPGREAYPGDVFYLHSRLLERAAKLSEERGGGSMTALPIIETMAGDISAYIPTNVISITDGQIFLETELFNAGMRPAINVGLSVSRVGGSAQIKAMRKVAGKLRLDLAQYRELAVFSQFASDLDPATQEQLNNGLRLTYALIQPQYKAMSLPDQVIVLSMITRRKLLGVPVKNVASFCDGFLEYVITYAPDIREYIEKTGELTEEQYEKLGQLADAYRKEQLQDDGDGVENKVPAKSEPKENEG